VQCGVTLSQFNKTKEDRNLNKEDNKTKEKTFEEKMIEI